MMKRLIFLLSLFVFAGCQNQSGKLTQVDPFPIDQVELSTSGIYMINSNQDQYLVFHDFGLDPESVEYEQKGNEYIVHFKKDSPKEDVVVYQMKIDSKKEAVIRILDEQNQEYSIENVILEQE